MTGRLLDRVAVVTGGAAGIGAACAQRLLEEGASVVITDIDAARGQATARNLGARFLEHDVALPADWKRISAAITEEHGRLDILVNNAAYVGSSKRGSPENTDLEDLRRIFQVNFEGVLLGCKSAIKIMRPHGAGSIINVSSIGAFGPTPFLTAYGASKAAVLHLTKTVAQYCGQERLKIRCNAVHPGVVRTEMWENTVRQRAQEHDETFEEAASFWTSRIPLGAPQAPEDIAAAVAFLGSDDASNITGSRIVVDGGMTFR